MWKWKGRKGGLVAFFLMREKIRRGFLILECLLLRHHRLTFWEIKYAQLYLICSLLVPA